MTLARVIRTKVTGDALTAKETNWLGRQLARGIDGRGGRCTPINKVTISGANGLEIGGTAKLLLERRTHTRAINGQVISDIAAADTWLPDIAGRWTSLTTNVCRLYHQLDVPNGAIVTGYSAYIDPAAHGALPAGMPAAALVAVDVTTGATTTLAQVIDSSATVAAFDALHAISATSLSVPMLRSSKRYFIRLESESGANAQILCVYSGTLVTYVLAAQDDGAA